jgi:hypothetical protein
MADNPYIVGQVVFLRARLSDPSTGDPTDPTTQDPVDDPTVQMTVYKPDGTPVSPAPSLAHASTGTYTTSVIVDQSGHWVAISLSTGAAAGAGRDRFYVSPIP